MQENNKKINTATVSDITNVTKDLFLINIHITDFKVKAGQFISVLCDDFTLRRPFSVMNYENDKLSILFKLKGKGTEYMSRLSVGDTINFTGAFGNGFNTENKKSLLIGAGVGIAPILFLRKALTEKNIQNKTIGGFLNKDSIPNNINLDRISTDDGSFGDKGSILNFVEEEIISYKPGKIYSCAPSIVLKNICELSEKYNIECEIAMEKEMACSIGVCRGCVIELKNGKNATVCKDGPIFRGSEIKW